MTKRPKTTVSCQCPPDIKDRFQRLYPYTLSRFLILCMKKALKDKTFFDNIYFGEIDLNLSNEQFIRS